jgi:hypothetical protein
MAKLEEVIAPVGREDHNFVGTIAFRNEQITLPDGSAVALGIDGAHWVIIFQKEKRSQFMVYDYDGNTGQFRIDKRPGTPEELSEMRKLIKYFFANAQEEDLVTIMPQKGGI